MELDDDTLFCYGMVDYPVTEELYYNASYYDALAKADYRKLLEKWKITQANESLTDPSSDCLAFSRYFFCSYYFPRCDSLSKPAQPMCDYVCAIYLLRCPFEDQSYCNVQSSELTCSLSLWNSSVKFGLFLTTLLIWTLL